MFKSRFTDMKLLVIKASAASIKMQLFDNKYNFLNIFDCKRSCFSTIKV